MRLKEWDSHILAMGTAKPSVLCHCRLMVNLCRMGRTLLSSVCRVPSETGPGSPWLSIPASATPVGSTYRSLEQVLVKRGLVQKEGPFWFWEDIRTGTEVAR